MPEMWRNGEVKKEGGMRPEPLDLSARLYCWPNTNTVKSHRNEQSDQFE